MCPVRRRECVERPEVFPTWKPSVSGFVLVVSGEKCYASVSVRCWAYDSLSPSADAACVVSRIIVLITIRVEVYKSYDFLAPEDI